MAKILKHDVHVTDDKLNVTVLKAGDTVPRKLQKYVTNPKAFIAEDDAPKATTDEPDPRDELVAELKKRELPTDGSVDELRERIATFDAEQAGGSTGDDPDDDEE